MRKKTAKIDGQFIQQAGFEDIQNLLFTILFPSEEKKDVKYSTNR